jgi:REP element-mobilizing transposase RayT
MPQIPGFPFPRRYNTLRLLGYEYNSPFQLCAISLVTDLRRPLFADVILAKSILKCLLNEQTLRYLRVRAFTLMPDHLHTLAGVREPNINLPVLIGRLKSYTTQQYWKRSREIVESGIVSLPSTFVGKTDPREEPALLRP